MPRERGYNTKMINSVKLSYIKSVFIGKSSLKEGKENISAEIKEYISSSREKGKTMSVYLAEDIDLSVGENELRILGEAFLNDELTALEISYIADALLLSNRVIFENEDVADRMGYLTDAEINGPINKEVVR